MLQKAILSQDKVYISDRIQNFMYNVNLYPLKDTLSFEWACTKPLGLLNWFRSACLAVSLFLPPPQQYILNTIPIL